MKEKLGILTLVALSLGNVHASEVCSELTSREHPQLFTPAQYGVGTSVLGTTLFELRKDKNCKGGEAYLPLYRVKLEPGATFGWGALLDTRRDSIEVETTLAFETAPRTWGRIDTKWISADRKSVSLVTEEVVVRQGGSAGAFGIWEVEAGDPEGTATLTIRIEGRLVGSFVIEMYR